MNKNNGLAVGLITAVLAVLFTASSPAAAQEVSFEAQAVHAEQFRQMVIRAEKRPMFSSELLAKYVAHPEVLHAELMAEGAILPEAAASTVVVGPAPVISGNTQLVCMFSGCAQNYISFWLTGQNLQHIAWGMMTPKGVSYGQGVILSHLSGYQGPIKLGVIFQFGSLAKPFTFTGGTDDNSKIIPPVYQVH